MIGNDQKNQRRRHIIINQCVGVRIRICGHLYNPAPFQYKIGYKCRRNSLVASVDIQQP